MLRRVAFPENPPTEWFVVDLLEHADHAAASPDEVVDMLARALAHGKFDRGGPREMAKRYGSRATIARVRARTAGERIVSFVHENPEEFTDPRAHASRLAPSQR